MSDNHWHDCPGCGLKYGHERPPPFDRDDDRGEIEQRRKLMQSLHTCPGCGFLLGGDRSHAEPPAKIEAGWRVRFEVRHRNGPYRGELQYTCCARLMDWADWYELFRDDPFSRHIARPPTPEGIEPRADSLPVRVYRYVYPSGQIVDGCADPMEVDSDRLCDIGGMPLPLDLVTLRIA